MCLAGISTRTTEPSAWKLDTGNVQVRYETPASLWSEKI